MTKSPQRNLMLTQRSLSVTTGSRLHFGLFSVGQVGTQPQFGGCGLMICEPKCRVVLEPASSLEIVGKESELVQKCVRRGFEHLRHALKLDDIQKLPFKISAIQTVPRHSGFGSGTQLALAVGVLLSNGLGFPTKDAAQLGSMMDRGRRSAIGTYGFFRGGFLVDRGREADDELARLDLNFSFPDQWPILLLNLKSSGGIHGKAEAKAFQNIPSSTKKHRETMIERVKNEIGPAIATSDYEGLGNALFEYGRCSGSAYASVQGGDFQSPEVEKLVYRIRDFGVPAVGQSSWGPCVFAIARNDEMANQLKTYLADHYQDDLEITQTSALNRGAEIKWQDLE